MRIHVFISFSLLLAVASPAHTIECQKARSKVEKRICASEKLMKLDRSLNELYENTLALAESPEKLRQDQIRWVREVRSKCDSDACLEQAYRDRTVALNATPGFRWKLYSDKKLGIEFSYPGNRKVIRKGNDIYITGFRMPEGVDYIIHFKAGDGDFKSANAEESIFEERNGKWFAAIGRFENPPAEPIKGEGWRGVRTTVVCGISDKETGFHAAGGECLWALISDGKRYVLADTQGILGLDKETEKSLLSLRLLPRP